MSFIYFRGVLMRILYQTFFLFTLLISATSSYAQCDTDYNKKQSPKIANYTIDVYLDHEAKTATCKQKLVWKNTSPDTLDALRFYMYINAFKDLKSSYLKGGSLNVFGQDLSKRKPIEWGEITMTSIVDEEGNDLSLKYDTQEKRLSYAVEE